MNLRIIAENQERIPGLEQKRLLLRCTFGNLLGKLANETLQTD